MNGRLWKGRKGGQKLILEVLTRDQLEKIIEYPISMVDKLGRDKPIREWD